MNIYAHTSVDSSRPWESLADHARRTAAAAGVYASAFEARAWGEALGLLHDLGKGKPEFQAYLKGAKTKAPHSAEGAKVARKHYGEKLGGLLAAPIAGHHSGLPNGADHAPKAGARPALPLNQRLAEAREMPVDSLALPDLRAPAPGPFKARPAHEGFAKALFMRMLFSCLVDADSVATEGYYAARDPADDLRERAGAEALRPLKAALDAHLEGLAATAPDTEVNRLRAGLLASARAKAAAAPGLFTLTAPTGLGKTLASLSFALDHALAHGLRRIVYVIPFTSIIEQTAGVFRKALKDEDAVLEHHSGFDPVDQYAPGEADDEEKSYRELSQSWDSPIVVTTAVQFFESFFSNRRGPCRKLHRLARSVIILDEAQTLPPALLRPCLALLNELARGYGSSVVLCTATQPAVQSNKLNAPEALAADNVNEIAPPGLDGVPALRRARLERAGTLSDGALLEIFRETPQALCVVNSRRHARALHEAMAKAGLEGARHLSTLMCAAHRRAALKEIRAEIKAGRPVRLVSTSLIEAGVDIDLPVVMRAEAGLDSVVQAAGRCNREGGLGPEGGRMILFSPEPGEGRDAPKDLALQIQIGADVLRRRSDALAPETVTEYFAMLYWLKGAEEWKRDPRVLDKFALMAEFDGHRGDLAFRFADIAQDFRMIESGLAPVIIPAEASAEWGAPDEAMRVLRFAPKIGGVLRRLQPHVVQIPPRERARLVTDGAAEVVRPAEFGDRFVVLTNKGLYGRERGLDASDPTRIDGVDLFC